MWLAAFVSALLALAAAALAGMVLWGGVWLFWRLSFPLPARKAVEGRPFLASNDQGNFGEILTAVLVVGRGWRQLPSKLAGGGHGIDGLFVRRRGGGLHVLITETKTNTSSYKTHQLETGKLIATIAELFAEGWMEWDIAQAIIRGLKRRSPFVHRQCWRHLLNSGQTLIYRANRSGELTVTSRACNSAAMMESLLMMLGDFDRSHQYIAARQKAARQDETT